MEQNTEQNKVKRKAKITIEIDGRETEVIETDLFLFIANQGERTKTITLCDNVDSFQIADHIRATEQHLEKIKRKAPQAEALVTILKAVNQVPIKEFMKEDAKEE